MATKSLHLLGGMCLFATVAAQFKMTSYQITFERQDIFAECEESPEHYLTKLFDISQVNRTLLEDNTIYLKGPLKTVMDTSNIGIIQGQGRVFKKSRGQWVDTIYNVRKNDICHSLYNPSEFWYKQTSKIPENQRACPPPKDYVIDLDLKMDTVIKNFDKGQSEGDYKLKITLIYGRQPDDFLCVVIYFNASKI